MENAFGKKIKKLRKTNNLTLKQLAEKLKVSFQAIEKWEKGETMPNGKRIEALADALGVKSSEFYQQDNEVKEPPVQYESGMSINGMVVVSADEYKEQKNREIEMLKTINELRSELNTYQKQKIEELNTANG
jgi:transcriptional regulator with XRE-family HTH domain